MTPAEMTVLLTALAFVAGVLVTRGWYRRERRLESEAASEIERDIVRAAMQRGGRISALEVRSRHARSVADVERQLRRLHANGYCESELAPEGYPVYIFPAFDEAPLRALRVEKQILRLARDSGGVVGVAQVAVETDLAYLEARRLLDEMVEDGICAPGPDADTYSFVAVRGRKAAARREVAGGRAEPLRDADAG